jgi:hypothetical protein
MGRLGVSRFGALFAPLAPQSAAEPSGAQRGTAQGAAFWRDLRLASYTSRPKF